MIDYRKLLSVSKPGRYAGMEINAFKKEIANKLGICLVFPDLYEIGMSHLGLQILYEKINLSEVLAADRFYMPWADAISVFGKDIYVSVESKKPLSSFQILGFSLCYELTYTNVINILKMSDIPVYNEQRTNSPIVVAGGGCSYNPAVLNNIIDVFFIGEMDEKFTEVCEALFYTSTNDRLSTLEFLNKYDFCYVPLIKKHKIVRKHIFTNFNKKISPVKPLVPTVEIIHDKVPIEVTRGCLNGCRFCQAGYISRPMREKNSVDIIKQVLTDCRATGYMDYTLLSLSLSDYTNLGDLVKMVSTVSMTEKLAFYLSSIRASTLDENLLKSVSFLSKSGFTIAPEAGSQRLRDVINKNLSEEDLVKTVQMVASHGWYSVKLYFMIGLPTEEFEDIVAIVHLSDRLKKAGKSVNKNFNIIVSVSNFVPKVFTPFQWAPFERIESLFEKQQFLRENLRKRGIRFKFHNIKQSFVEAVLSRGDEIVNNLLVNAEMKGCIFDEWTEFFNFNNWLEASKVSNINLEDYAYKSFSLDDEFGWDNIDIGVDKYYFIEEYKRAIKQQVSKGCIDGNCNNCGVCDFKEVKNILSEKISERDIEKIKIKDFKEAISVPDKYVEYRMIFSKTRLSTLLSANEITRLLTFLVNKVSLKVKFSEGFNKRPLIKYIYPLPVGISGENEIIIIEALPFENKKTLINLLNSYAVKGLFIKDIERSNKGKIDEATLFYKFDNESFSVIKSHIGSKKAYYNRTNKSGIVKRIEIDDFIISIGENRISLKINNKGGFNFIDFFKFWNYNYIDYDIIRDNILIN